jgi:DNA invertase Pin-like site-specific DNA recombinase
LFGTNCVVNDFEYICENLTLGQFEREQTSERVAVNFRARALRGLLNGGPAPLGYDKVEGKSGLLSFNEDEANLVRRIFEIFLHGGSKAKTIIRLHQEGIFPKRTSQKQKAAKEKKPN